jgi:hypothetical protein
VFAIIIFGMDAPLRAQFYNGSQLSFGKNRVQHQQFNWIYYRSDRFDVYFYLTGKELANYTLYKAPQLIHEIEQALNFTSTKKLQFIVYNTQSDFRESNFGFDDDDFYNQGGVVNVYGTKIYLYFDGSHHNFDRMLKSGIMNVYSHLLIEGESLRKNISSEYLVNVPAWFYTGLSSYVSENWNSTIDAHVKNGILTQKYASFDELSPVDATYAGHSFWKFIVDRYGKEAIPNILYATRSMRNAEKGFYSVTGVSFKQLLVDWYRYFYVIYNKEIKRDAPEDNGVLARPKKGVTYDHVILSPDGESYAYTTNDAGQVSIWLKTKEMKRPKRIFRKYQRSEDNPDLTYPVIAWHPSGNVLGFTFEEKGRCFYYPYNIDEKKLDKRLLVLAEKVLEWKYSPDGKMMLFSGFKNGQTDIMLYNFQARSFQYITQDIFDDRYPAFINGQKQIVFASDRNHDTLNTGETFYNYTPQSTLDLFLYDFEHKNPQLLRLTNTPFANETDVRILNPQEFIFLSDMNGIINRYVAHFDSTIVSIDTAIHYQYYSTTAPQTDKAYSILSYDYLSDNQRLAEIYLHHGASRITISEYQPTPSTDQPAISDFQQTILNNRQMEDSLAKMRLLRPNSKATHGFYQPRLSDLNREKNPPEEGAVVENQEKQDNRNPDFVPGVGRFYHVQYTMNQLVTQADFSFLNTSYQQFTGSSSPIYLNTSINALIMVGIKDLFEDHRITGGFRIGFDLNSYEMMFSYENLSKRLDHQIILYRQSIKDAIDYYVYKLHTNSLFYIMKYPFDKWNSLRLTLTGRYETAIIGAMDDISLKTPNENRGWGGVKLEYVFDSSKELYTNLWKGTKFKVFVEYEQLIAKESKNLFVIGFDARQSFKLYKKMTFAIRLAGSTNVGSARLIYYMGGIDNWMLAKFNSEIWVDNTRQYAYQTLATNMRGFAQNTRNGTSFVVLNAELRVPFVQLIAGHNVSNNFFNSLQFILFGDYGTAWTGISPYGEDNSLYYRHITKGPITAVVKRQVDPFVGGVGFGLRASLLGYFLRLDYAWGIEGGKVSNKRGMLMFSLGLDF